MPSRPTHEGLYYSEFDASAVKTARLDGVTGVQYLHDYAERRNIHEYGADWVLDIALAIPANFASDAFLVFVGYVWSRVRNARRQGLVGLESRPALKVSIGSFTKSPDGSPDVKDFAIEGDAREVVTGVMSVFAPDQLEPALERLNELEGQLDARDERQP